MIDPMNFLDFSRFFCIKGMQVTIKFDQQVVNWINQQYPDYNWFAAEGPNFSKASLFDHNQETAKVRSFDMNDFAFPVGVMFDPNTKTVESLMRRIVEYLTEDLPKHTDIYLLSLKGILTPIDDDGFIKEITNINGNPLATVGVRCVIRYYFDDGSEDEDESS